MQTRDMDPAWCGFRRPSGAVEQRISGFVAGVATCHRREPYRRDRRRVAHIIVVESLIYVDWVFFCVKSQPGDLLVAIITVIAG